MFGALLKYWRGRRGLSQLALALEAGISARHLSFLESGRAQPSEPMALRLFRVLEVPLRDQDEALRASGFSSRFGASIPGEIPAAVDRAIARMMRQHEPYPLTVITPDAVVLRQNRGAEILFAAFVAEPQHLPEPLDMFSLVFDPRLLRPFVLGWEATARQMLGRLQREALAMRRDARLAALVERVLAYPGVPRDWREPDLSAPVDPTFTVRLRRGDLAVSFFTAITVFSAPQQVILEELRLESCFPLDDQTAETCARLVGLAG